MQARTILSMALFLLVISVQPDPIPSLAAPQASQLVHVGENFLVTGSDVEAGMAGKPSIAFDGTNFLVVYRVSRLATNQAYDIYATRITPNGVVLDSDGIPISTVVNEDPSPSNQYIPSVGFDGTNYMVVWVEGRMGGNPLELQYELYCARVTPAGVVLDPDGIQISSTHQPSMTPEVQPVRMPSIAFDGENYLLAWRTGIDFIRGMRLTPAGVPLDGDTGFMINSTSSFYPSVAFDGTNYLVVWHDVRTAVGGWSIYGAFISPDGAVTEPPDFLINDTPLNQEHSTVEFNGTDYLVAWHEWPTDSPTGKQDGQVSAARVTPGGVVLDDPAILVYPYVQGEDRPSITWDGTEYLISWVTQSSAANIRHADSYGVRMSSAGVILDEQPMPLGVASGHQWRPFTAYGAGRILVLWNEDMTRCAGCIGGQLLERQEVAPDATPAEPELTEIRTPAKPEETSAVWTNQKVSADSFVDVWGVGPQEVYASATSGKIYRYLGANWQLALQVQPGLTQYGSWAAGRLEMWTTGWCWSYERYNGIVWQNLPCNGAGHGVSIWGTQLKPVMAVGTQGNTQLYQNGAWQPQTKPVNTDLWDVWGSSTQDIYAVGEFGKLMRYNGSSWSRVSNLPVLQALNGIWGTGAQDIFVVGDFGTILHFNGTSWALQDSGTEETLFGVWGFAPDDVYAVGLHGTILHYNGAAWAAEDSGVETNLTDVWGTLDWAGDANRVWVVGEEGVVLSTTIPVAYEVIFLPQVRK
jgi:hypothetical protein